MDDLAVMIYVKWMILKDCLVEGVHDFFTDEDDTHLLADRICCADWDCSIIGSCI